MAQLLVRQNLVVTEYGTSVVDHWNVLGVQPGDGVITEASASRALERFGDSQKEFVDLALGLPYVQQDGQWILGEGVAIVGGRPRETVLDQNQLRASSLLGDVLLPADLADELPGLASTGPDDAGFLFFTGSSEQQGLLGRLVGRVFGWPRTLPLTCPFHPAQYIPCPLCR